MQGKSTCPFKIGDHINMGELGVWEIKSIEKMSNKEYVRLTPVRKNGGSFGCNICMNIDKIIKYQKYINK